MTAGTPTATSRRMPASRPPLAKGFIAELDGLRGIAILLVIVHRFWPRTGVGVMADAAGAGWIGVDLFFVISGFLIAGILLETRGEPGYFRNFYARRVLRIFPLFYLFVGGVLIAFSGNPEFRANAGSPIWYLLHLGNIPESLFDHDVPYWLAPVWSLAIEEQFYLTFPLVVALIRPHRLGKLLVGMLIAAPVIRLVSMLIAPDHERVQYMFTLCRLDTIAIGCLLAVIVRRIDVARHRRRIVQVAGVIVAASAVFAVVTGLDRTTDLGRTIGYSVVAFGCAAVVALVVLYRDTPHAAILRFAPLTYLGKLCFGLYLLHRPADTIVSALATRLGLAGDLWLMPAKIALAVVLATISWHLIERPFLRLKKLFSSAHHPAKDDPALTGGSVSPLRRMLRFVGLSGLVIMLAAGCGAGPSGTGDDGGGGGDDAMVDGTGDGGTDAQDPDGGTMTVEGTVLYPENRRHSPITPGIAMRLQALAAATAHDPRIFAKVGDSITSSTEFIRCFDGGAVDLGAHASLGPTISYFLQGNAGGGSPYERNSYVAAGGTTTRDALTGTPTPLDREYTAIDPRYAVVLFGTNDNRYGRSVDDFGADLWSIVDRTIARGIIPIVSSMPSVDGDPGTDARVPTFNRVIRAIAQGRAVPFIDLHRDLLPLPRRGLSTDGIHPSTAPGGACVLTASGLTYGYNVRNLVTIEALARTQAALVGNAADASAPLRSGAGTEADPVISTLPLADVGDTRSGEALHAVYTGCGSTAAGRAIVYKLQLAAQTTVEAFVVDRDTTDVDIHILTGSLAASACVAAGDKTVTATVGAGTVYIVVDARGATTDGEFALVVNAK